MQRTSPVHYIAPSAISITPNANDSANDIAVHIVRNTKIKVYSRGIVDMDSQAADYQEWTLTGRNRRLADDTAPYTIYARLNSTNKDDAYLVFAKKVYALGIWTDKYTALSFDGTSGRLYNGYWYVRLGDVPAPVDGKRTVDLDTGILGTEQFNSEWVANPDPLPLRVELSVTVNDEDAGPTPYVYWGETLVLTAMLKEGWTSDEKDRFDHWEIARDTGNTQADNTWNAVDRSATFGQTGSIELMHGRGATQGVRDDFNSAVNTTFIVNAMENTGTEQSPVYAVLKSASICIMAETWEKYELSLAAQMVTYSPITQTYSPNNGIEFNIRATDQKGDVFLMTNKQVTDAGLVAEYAVIDTDSWTAIAISGPDGNVADGTVPQDAFTTNQQSINVRIKIIKNGANKELHRATIAFLRDGEDSKEREWIFLRSTEAITFGTQEHPYPASISGGQVNPSDAATGSDTNKNQDGWVPEGWWDEQQGVDATNRYEYGAYRDFVHESGSTPAHWGTFSTPKIWNHYGKDGENTVRLDLDNEYDSIQYQGDGTTKVDQLASVQTTASLFDGTTDKSNQATFTIEAHPNIDDADVSISGRTVTVNGLSADGYVVVRATYPIGSNKHYDAKFTVKKLVGIDKYDLVVTPNAVPVNTSNTVPDTTINVQVYRTPANGGTRHLVEFTNKTTNDYGLTLSVKDSLNNNLTETTGTGTVTTRTFNLTGTMATNADNVMVVLTKDSMTQDSETVPITHVHNGADGSGANAVKIDLDNEMDSIPCDSDGKMTSQTVLEVNARIYDGATPVSSGVAVSSVGAIAGVSAVTSISNGVVNIKWTIPATGSGTPLSVDKYTSQIVLTWGGNSYYATFTVNVVKSGEPGVSPTIMQLMPDPTQISFKRDSGGSIPSSTQTLSLSIKKSDGNGTSVITVAASGLTVRYRTDQAPSSASDGTSWPSAGLPVGSSDTYGNVYIAAFDSNGTLVDRETVAIMKDGENGQDAPYDVLTYGRASTRVLSGGTPSGFDSTTGWQNVAPATSDTYPYIWQRTQHYNSAGQQTSTSYVCLTGEDGEQGVPGGPGPAGEDAVNVVVSPASMIVQQDINDKDAIAYAADNNLGRFSIQVLKGSTACTITRIEAVATHVYVYNTSSTGPENPPGTCIWQPGATIADMYLKGIGKDNQNNYYTTGQITLSIYYTDPDTSSGKNITIIVKVYVNLIGSWSETIVGDTKTEVARSLTYGYDPDSGEVISLENFGQYIKSSEVNISRITKQVNNGKNMLKGVLTGDGWKTGSNDADVTLDSDGWFVANGVGGNTFKSPSFDVVKDNTITLSFWADSTSSINVVFNRGGNTSTIGTTYDATTQRHRVSYTPAADGTCFVVINTAKIYHPQVEVGTTPTQFNASATEEESIMRQTSNSIELRVSGKINAFNLMSLLNWTDGSNNVQAADVKLGKAGEANSLYSPQLYLDAGTYTFSGYFSGFLAKLITRNTAAGTAKTTNITPISTAEKWNGLTRYYFNFTLDPGKYVNINLYIPAQDTAALYRPQLERGSEMSRYVPCGDAIGSTGYAEITANAVGLGVRSDLGDVGIHIQGASQDRYVAVKGGKFKMLDENDNETFVLDEQGNLSSKGSASFDGTIKARNLFRTLAVSGGSNISGSYAKCVTMMDSETNVSWIYVLRNVPASSYGHAFTAGQYLTNTEFENLVDPDHMFAWQSQYDDFCVCTGPADEVLLVNPTNGIHGGYTYIPRCQDMPGKTITIRNNGGGVSEQATGTIKQVDGASVFIPGVNIKDTLDEDYDIDNGLHVNPSESITTGQGIILYSTGTVWSRLSKFQNDIVW